MDNAPAKYTLMEVTLNSTQFQATKNLHVVVFQYWTVFRELVHECVPLEDNYNLERADKNHTVVGAGIMVKPGVKGRWGMDWVVYWQQTHPSPPCPYPPYIISHLRNIPYHAKWMWLMVKLGSWDNAWLIAKSILIVRRNERPIARMRIQQ